jgi:hypothetical protein
MHHDINARFPNKLQKFGMCKHYHGGMSAEYLQATYDEQDLLSFCEQLFSHRF